MKALINTGLIALLIAIAFISTSQPDTSKPYTVPESIKEPIEFPDPDLMKEHDKLPIEVVNETESQSVREMYSSNLFMARLGQQAETKAIRSDAQDFGELISEEHSAMNESLWALADKKGIIIPDTLENERASKLDELIKKTGKEYDLSYITLMVETHEDLIRFVERAEKSCADSDIRKWFKAALPLLQQHFDKAKQLRETITQTAN